MRDKEKDIPLLPQEIIDTVNTKHFDIPYCEQSPSQTLDFWYPNKKSDRPYPVIVYFHGGGFRYGTKRDHNLEPMLRGLERGYAVISAEYRKSDEARFPAMIYDAKAVIRFINANAEKYQINPKKIAAWGMSSGGWLVSMLGVTIGNPAFEDLDMGNVEYSSKVHAVIDWCGPCGGFLEIDKEFLASGLGEADHNDAGSPESLFLGAPLATVPELVNMANPCTYVRKGVPSFFIVHGSNDQVVPVEQSQTFYKALVKAIGEDNAGLIIAEGKQHHGNMWYNESWLSAMCLDFLDKTLKLK